eukprot:6214792-Pleurochrysis_carterae.AAC.3
MSTAASHRRCTIRHTLVELAITCISLYDAHIRIGKTPRRCTANTAKFLTMIHAGGFTMCHA